MVVVPQKGGEYGEWWPRRGEASAHDSVGENSTEGEEVAVVVPFRRSCGRTTVMVRAKGVTNVAKQKIRRNWRVWIRAMKQTRRLFLQSAVYDQGPYILRPYSRSR